MFNNNKKTKNIILSSSSGVVEQFLNYVLAFVFRTVFLYVLSQEYLGISGLFTNVLQVFSLAELGIGSVIAFRLYEPVKNRDIYKCSQLIEFYKKIYLTIAIVVLLIGSSLFPFLKLLIKDPGEIPADVNIYVVYGLFVLHSFCSYFFVYYQSLLAADQKGYVISIANSISAIVSNIIRIVFLLVTRNYVLVLLVGIIFGIVYNFVFGQYIKFRYKAITDLKTVELTPEEKKKIFRDSGSLMFHKIGYTMVNSTDSILLSKVIGIGVVGLYSNYALIATAVDVILNKIFGSFVPTIGYFLLGNDSEKAYTAYKRLRFLNFWAASFCAVCIFVLIDPFITIWLNASYLLDKITVIIISANILINSSRIINASFVNAAGLFVKDKARPIIQALLNLVLSIIFIKFMGVSGVFLGTILSTFLTVWWREGFVLYRNIFKKPVKEYFVYNFVWIALTIIVACVFSWLSGFLSMHVWGFIIKLVMCVIGVNLIYFVLFYNTDGHRYFREMIKERMRRQ